MPYRNIKAEMSRNGITQKQVASSLGMSSNNFSLKLNGQVSMTVSEAKTIQKQFFPNATLDYLLAESN